MSDKHAEMLTYLGEYVDLCIQMGSVDKVTEQLLQRVESAPVMLRALYADPRLHGADIDHALDKLIAVVYALKMATNRLHGFPAGLIDLNEGAAALSRHALEHQLHYQDFVARQAAESTGTANN